MTGGEYQDDLFPEPTPWYRQLGSFPLIYVAGLIAFVCCQAFLYFQPGGALGWSLVILAFIFTVLMAYFTAKFLWEAVSLVR